MKNCKVIMEYYNSQCPVAGNSYDVFFAETDSLEGVRFEGMTWSQEVSNSHVSPKGGVRNWCAQDKTLPTSYPGWQGQMHGSCIRLPKDNGRYPYTNLYRLVGLHIAGGGGSNERHSYEISIFVADWPGLLPLHQATEHKVMVAKRRTQRRTVVDTARRAQEEVIRRLKHGTIATQ